MLQKLSRTAFALRGVRSLAARDSLTNLVQPTTTFLSSHRPPRLGGLRYLNMEVDARAQLINGTAQAKYVFSPKRSLLPCQKESIA